MLVKKASSGAFFMVNDSQTIEKYNKAAQEQLSDPAADTRQSGSESSLIAILYGIRYSSCAGELNSG
ncbi:MAG: hypothetical protein HQL49_04465 [Gammaproteobacteria bacterium]|nr:hypothetical protein [Gammaproteobacteria bacterium]